MNKVYRVTLSGGIIGWFTTSPKRALQACFGNIAQEGEEVALILSDQTNVLQNLVYLLILMFTLLLWCPAPGYLVVTRPRIRADVLPGATSPDQPARAAAGAY